MATLEGCSRNRPRRKLRFRPKTAFCRLPPVHRTDLKRQLRVDFLEGQQRVRFDHSPSPRRMAGHLRNAAKEPESTSSAHANCGLNFTVGKFLPSRRAQANRGLIAFKMAGSPCRDDLQRNPAPGLSLDRLKRLLNCRWRNPKQTGIGLS